MGAILCVGYAVIARPGGPKREAAGDGGGLSFDDVPLPASRRILARTFQAVGESLPARRQDSEPLRRRLMTAGYRWPTAVTIFSGIKVAVALSLAGITGWTILFFDGDAGSSIVPVLAAAGFGYLLPDRLLDRLISRRSQEIRSGLPPAVDLLVLAIEAGQSLDQAILDIAKSLAKTFPELSEELLVFHLEVRAGKSRYEALRTLADRSPEAEMKKLVAVLLDGDRYGTSLGPALRTHSRYLRTRIRQQAQERARKLTVKLIMPTFFLIFPAVLVVTLGPAYLQLKESLGSFINSI